MRIDLDEIPDALDTDGNLPRATWPLIAAWIDERWGPGRHDAEELRQVWTAVAAAWLEKLAAAIPGYDVMEFDNFLLLSVNDVRLQRRLLNWCEHARDEVLKRLPGVARDGMAFGKHPVLAFSHVPHYRDYVETLGGDATRRPAGSIVDEGLAHMILFLPERTHVERTIVNLLAMKFVRHLPLPRWLESGLSHVIEDMVIGGTHLQIDTWQKRRHREYWSPQKVESFWAGDSFADPDDGPELSHELAKILLHNLMWDYPEAMLAFVGCACRADAGFSAARRELGADLGDYVAQFLGPGNWRPKGVYA